MLSLRLIILCYWRRKFKPGYRIHILITSESFKNEHSHTLKIFYCCKSKTNGKIRILWRIFCLNWTASKVIGLANRLILVQDEILLSTTYPTGTIVLCVKLDFKKTQIVTCLIQLLIIPNEHWKETLPSIEEFYVIISHFLNHQ